MRSTTEISVSSRDVSSSMASLRIHMLTCKYDTAVKKCIGHNKCDTNSCTLEYDTPLHFKIIRYLVEECNVYHHFKPFGRSDTPLHVASLCGHLDIVPHLVEECNVEANQCIEHNERSDTPLHVASLCGHLDIVRYLVEVCNANANQRNERSHTSLHIASQYGHLDIVQYLVEECNVDTNQCNEHNERSDTPLRVASQYDQFHIIQYLVEEGQVDAEDGRYGTTAVYAA